MKQTTNLILENAYGQNISVYALAGSTQFIVVTPHSEYAFTRLEEAQNFASQLASKQALLKTASVDRGEAPGMPPVVKPKMSKGFRF